MRQILVYVSIGLVIAALAGCASSNQQAPVFATEGGDYTSAFPTQDVSTNLDRIQRSILRITSTTIYATYFFEDANLTLEELHKTDLEEVASDQSTIDHSKAGTAVSLLQNNRHIALLTAEHVLNAPDTLINYKRGPGIPENKYIRSAGIKIKQRNYLHTLNKLLEIDVLAANRPDDLALIKVDRSSNAVDAPPLQLNTGSGRNLKLGSFLYILGYPLGSAMVTRGIVSVPNYDRRGSFLTDALFNHGISGGLIVASRDNYNSFEWVGLAVTASASEHYFIVPDPSKQDQYTNLSTYSDTLFISQKNIINYGVTQATPIEKILQFIFVNNNELRKIGLSATNLGGQ